VIGWHSEPGVARTEAAVVEQHRNRGVGSALLAALAGWARAGGQSHGEAPVDELDASSQAWATRRGFVEIGRDSLLVLDLAAIEVPGVDPPDGIEIATWAERPDAIRGMYEVACETYPDVPGEESIPMDPFESWLANDLQGTSDRPEATFVAFAGDEVVGYAKLSLSSALVDTAFHDITGVKRAWRGRGIAGALKRAEIAWAKRPKGYQYPMHRTLLGNEVFILEHLNLERQVPERMDVFALPISLERANGAQARVVAKVEQ
jgi:GNAT superfamily N-acetyltransferase